ncbi:MAG: L-ribulose-5-phosphate 4-epimerase [Lentisphaerae bacterium RIFOXYB12_FULL_65_16]|nr:MAG: L-ribulose-5-phosphate 4-epimerase [Lentisphaerae bacterium RIFOXYA12_64_32]OGV87204.1 MAG: L-ribulose-5-phosphate 4-epimerase [Lentisphaerae bacterium RIFOXYB12_FULL_65_16]
MKTPPELQALRKDVLAAHRFLCEQGLAVLTWGNVSGIHRASGVVAIKPSGVAYDELTVDNIVLVELDGGRVLTDDLRPSSDLPTHLALYRAFPQIGGVAHTHSRHATAFAQACRSLPCLGTTHADHFCGTIPVTRPLRSAETAKDYESNTGQVIIETFRDKNPVALPAVLVAHHAPFTWGDSPAAAVCNSVVLEAVAGMALETWQLDPAKAGIPADLQRCHFLRKHGPAAHYGQPQGPAAAIS